jgi:diguanylate cyclase (GGDEF)-like protein
MSGKNGVSPTVPAVLPELVRLPDLPQHAQLDVDLALGFWKNIPALSWLMSLEDGQLHVSGTHPDSSVVTAPVHVLGRLLRTVVREDGPASFQLLEVLPALDGTLHHYLVIGFPLSGLNGAPHPYLAGVAIDVTHQKVREEKLAHLALADELTGLYNLRGFQLFAEHDLKVARRRKTVSAIVYVDVDGLKEINDTRGHGDGDALLVSTAALLRHVFRECDVIGRLGGDEFAILASDVKGDPENLARRLKAEAPVAGATAGSPSGLAMSVGIASCPPDVSMSLADLIAAADQAMYRNKPRKAGRMSLAAAAEAIRQMFASTRAGPPGTST